MNNGDGTAVIRQLDIDTGDWNDTGTVLDFAQFGLGSRALNATAVDPSTGMMMGVLNGSATAGSLLVSFDLEGEIAFHGPIAGTIGESVWPSTQALLSKAAR